MVALLAFEDVDWSSDSTSMPSLLSIDLYAVDIVDLLLGLGCKHLTYCYQLQHER